MNAAVAATVSSPATVASVMATSSSVRESIARLEKAGRRLRRGPFRANPCSLQVLSELVRHLGMTIIIITDGACVMGHGASVSASW